MTDARPSPFSSLDKALLRSTAARPDDIALSTPTPIPDVPDPGLASEQGKRTTLPRRHADVATTKRQTEGSNEQASTLAGYPDDLIERLRRIVKGPGREVSFIRLSAEEKMALGDLVYQLKRSGRKTTETEISRIAVNFILADHAENGDGSVLARVLAALLA